MDGMVGKIGKGVPQGSLLSPALFDIYIQPLLDEVNGMKHNGKRMCYATAYADDTVIVTNMKHVREVWETFRASS